MGCCWPTSVDSEDRYSQSAETQRLLPRDLNVAKQVDQLLQQTQFQPVAVQEESKKKLQENNSRKIQLNHEQMETELMFQQLEEERVRAQEIKRLVNRNEEEKQKMLTQAQIDQAREKVVKDAEFAKQQRDQEQAQQARDQEQKRVELDRASQREESERRQRLLQGVQRREVAEKQRVLEQAEIDQARRQVMRDEERTQQQDLLKRQQQQARDQAQLIRQQQEQAQQARDQAQLIRLRQEQAQQAREQAARDAELAIQYEADRARQQASAQRDARQTKKQQQREERMNAAFEELAFDIQADIRTEPQFDCSKPLKYKHTLNTLNTADFQDTLQQLRVKYPEYILPGTVVECIELWAASKEHFIVHRGRSVSVRDLTPHQADERRVFGEYLCNCNRSWSSAGSWKDKFQKCKSCEREVYPYRQSRLQRSEHNDDEEIVTKPHDCARCQKCIEMGELCLPRYYHAAIC